MIRTIADCIFWGAGFVFLLSQAFVFIIKAMIDLVDDRRRRNEAKRRRYMIGFDPAKGEVSCVMIVVDHKGRLESAEPMTREAYLSSSNEAQAEQIKEKVTGW